MATTLATEDCLGFRRTPLHLAAGNGREKVVGTLIEMRADVAAIDTHWYE